MNTEINNYQINGEMVWQGRLSKINGVTQDKPVHFHIRPLNVNDAEAMGNLSENIYNNLREGEECFIHKHSKEYYYQVFQNPKINYIGVFVGQHLVGMSYLKICDNAKELQDELPNVEYNFFNEDRHYGNSRIASFGADSVLPAYRGNALNTVMIEYRMEQARRMGCTDCTSIVDRSNLWNMTPYFACRFNLFQTAIDPSDGGKISLLHKPIEKETVLSCFRARVSVPYDRFELIDNMIKKGFIGVEFDRTKKEVTFAHSSYYLPTKKKNVPIFALAEYKKGYAL
ncbi:MAG: hypothetical protein NC218_02855 [Acetobacter sp.]|nr:hypothetical protein [Acetobacter sp.]